MNKNKIMAFILPQVIISNIPILVNANTEKNINNKDIIIEEIEGNENQSLLSINTSENVERVLLPNGVWVNRNGSYDFVYQTVENETKVYTKNITGLRANYLITPKENVLLKLSSQDTLSGMGSMKFKNEINGTWTNYEPYKIERDWTLDSTEGLKTVYVVYKDIAGNETTEVFDKIILDKSGPQITSFTINNNEPYTKNQKVTLNINALDNYSDVSKLMISNDNINWTEVPYNTNILWDLSPGVGNKTVYVKAVDSLGNVGMVSNDNIYFDNILPMGSITINDDATITNSRNVKLKIDFKDIHSGVKRVTVIENNKTYNLTNISQSPIEIPWTLSHGATGQVSLEIEDNAGNVYKTNSNVITIATLEVTQFRLTNIVNPSVFPINKPFNPIVWTFPPQEMKSGANISFDINYSLDLDDKTTSVINGNYYIEIIGDNGYHKIVQANYSKSITNGFEATITLPSDAPVNSKVYLNSTIKAVLTNGTETFTNEAYFPGVGEKALIGVIKGNIKDDIIFNEIS